MALGSGTEPIRVDFLVYGECVCGWSMATHAGARWPKCPTCGDQVLPCRDVPGPASRHGRHQGYGYVAELHPESDAYTDPRIEVADAYSDGDEGGKGIRLGEARMAYRMYDRERLEIAQARSRDSARERASEAWRVRRLHKGDLRNLPRRYRAHPGTVRALIVGKLNNYAAFDALEFAQFCNRTLNRSRRKKWAQQLAVKLERSNAR